MAISIYYAQIRATELRDASRKFSSAVNCIDNAINNLNSGASTQRIKSAVSQLQTLKNDINPIISVLNTVANDIITVAYQIQREENE